jgi:hypothetical protein
MFGCLRRLGCLVVLVVLAAAAWFYRDRLTAEYRRITGGGREVVVAEDPIDWQPVSDSAAARARRSIESLSRRSGPVYTNLAAGDLASYVFTQLERELPPSARDIESAVVGDRVHVRASISLADLGRDALGPLASMLGDRETVQFGGTFDVVRPGLAEFVVQELKIKELALPQAAIPRLLRQIDRGNRPEGVAPNALPLEIPPYIGDIRVARGRITIYKTTTQ